MSAFSVEGSNRHFFVTVGVVNAEGPFVQRDAALDAKDRLERLARAKERACMTCRVTFMSEGPHNRRCTDCRKSSSAIFEGAV
jgi:tRNA(Ile2) C34 agmatinyltransferase TiaS